MDREGSPPPYTTSPSSSPLPNGPAHDNSNPRQNDPAPQYLIHLPGTSRSTYHSLHSTGRTQAPPEYPTNSIRIIPRISTARPSRQNIVIVPRQPVEATPGLTQRPGNSRSSLNTAQNVVIVPQQPAQRAPTSNQETNVSISMNPQENALIIRPARQSTPSPSLQGSLASSTMDDLPPPFVDEPLPSFAEAIAESKRRFPREFGFYSAFDSFSDMVIAERDDSNPLYYIETHHRLSNRKNVILYSGRFVYSPPLATADFPRFTSTINIELMATPTHDAEHHHLEKSGASGSGRVFSITFPGSDIPEHFEWEKSQGEEISLLHGRSHGEKLVRVTTGEIVAAWTAPLMVGKKGKIKFLGNRETLGEKFEVMAVISILAIMGKDHGSSKIGNPKAGGAGSGSATGVTS